MDSNQEMPPTLAEFLSDDDKDWEVVRNHHRQAPDLESKDLVEPYWLGPVLDDPIPIPVLPPFADSPLPQGSTRSEDEESDQAVLDRYYKQKYAACKETRKRLQVDIMGLKVSLEKVIAERDRMKTELESAHTDIILKDRQIAHLKSNLENSETREMILKSRLEKADSLLAQMRKEVAEASERMNAAKVKEDKYEEVQEEVVKALKSEIGRLQTSEKEMESKLSHMQVQGDTTDAKTDQEHSARAMELLKLKMQNSYLTDQVVTLMADLLNAQNHATTLEELLRATIDELECESERRKELEMKIAHLEGSQTARSEESAKLKDDLVKSKVHHDVLAVAYNRKLNKLWEQMVNLQKRNQELTQRLKNRGEELALEGLAKATNDRASSSTSGEELPGSTVAEPSTPSTSSSSRIRAVLGRREEAPPKSETSTNEAA